MTTALAKQMEGVYIRYTRSIIALIVSNNNSQEDWRKNLQLPEKDSRPKTEVPPPFRRSSDTIL
jgi:hypothetical protein